MIIRWAQEITLNIWNVLTVIEVVRVENQMFVN